MIPVFEPSIADADIQAVVAALRRGEISGNFGEALAGFEAGVAAVAGCRFGIATSSGTTALQLAVAAAGVGSGDEVLVSASTNIATALAAVHNGALPVPVDAEATTWNLDLDLIERLITPRTRAIIPVHLFGHPVDMERLITIAERHNLIVIEDVAQAHGALCHSRPVGSFGAMGCFSFYANKTITTGEGGMVTTNDPVLAERLRYLRNVAFGTPRFRHEVLGFNFRMTSYQAALGLSQLDRLETIIGSKRALAQRYSQRLQGLPGLDLQLEQPWARHVNWVQAVRILPEVKISRDAITTKLRTNGIDTRTFFMPMNQQPCFLSLPNFRAGSCPVADALWLEGFYLPSTPTLTDSELDQICAVLRGAMMARY